MGVIQPTYGRLGPPMPLSNTPGGRGPHHRGAASPRLGALRGALFVGGRGGALCYTWSALGSLGMDLGAIGEEAEPLRLWGGPAERGLLHICCISPEGM